MAAEGEHTLVIEGHSNFNRYWFTVEKNLKKSKTAGASTNPNDSITRQSAHGRVKKGKDAYTFDGDLVAFYSDAEMTVRLDGEPVNVDRLPDSFIEIEGTGPSASYNFSVIKNLQKSTAHGASINSGDEVINDHQTAQGRVGPGTDAYTFDGYLTAFNYSDSSINVFLDGRPMYLEGQTEHYLQIEGGESGSPTSYSFSVGEFLSLTGRGSYNPGDHTGVRGAWGRIGPGMDTYAFSGDLVAFEFDGGPINVLVDGKPAHVGRLPDYLLRIEGNYGPSPIRYSFTVSNDLRKSAVAYATINRTDKITNHHRSASGGVQIGKVDAYTFNGDLRAFDLNGKASVSLNGQAAHVNRLPDHV